MSRIGHSDWPWSLRGDDPEWDWFVLVDAQDRYVSDACVEGTADEWRQIADAIEAGEDCAFKRCRVKRRGDDYLFSSPRNTQGRAARFSGRERALGLVAIIRAAIATHDEEQKR